MMCEMINDDDEIRANDMYVTGCSKLSTYSQVYKRYALPPPPPPIPNVSSSFLVIYSCLSDIKAKSII